MRNEITFLVFILNFVNCILCKSIPSVQLKPYTKKAKMLLVLCGRLNDGLPRDIHVLIPGPLIKDFGIRR